MAKALEQKPMMDFRPVYEMTAAILEQQQRTLEIVRGMSEIHRHPERQMRPYKCTQAEFDTLPGLVTRSVFCYWTGLNSNALTDAVREKQVEEYKPNPHGHALYFKREIARMTGFKL